MKKLSIDKIMKNCQNELETIYETGKAKNLTQAAIYEAVDVYNRSRYTPQETINTQVANFFKGHGYSVKTQGIGWVISI